MLLISSVNHIKPLLFHSPIQRIMTPDVFLTSSILLETTSTLCLQKVQHNKLWFIPVYTGYGISFYLFPKCFEKYNLNVAYTIWSGVGILFTFLVDVCLQREAITFKKVLALFMIINGICMIK